MAVNIAPGLNFLVAIVTKPWNEIPLTTDDTIEVYSHNDGAPVSWKPGRTINTLTDSGVVAGKGYQLTSKVARDLSGIFSPPLPSGSGSGIVTMI